jgi:ParB-like chromosome segregation protein Spo0J
MRADARPLDAEAVARLAESIAMVGLINPIRVRAVGDGWEVIAGAHRLAASKSLGLVEIDADLVDDDDLHAELAMIDENLCREELSPADRAQQTARRKAIYQELNPEAKQGGDHKSPDRTTPESFAVLTAKLTGKSPAAVYRDTSRGENILPEVFDLIRGTKLDTGSYLDKLKAMPGSQQFRAAQRDLLNLRQQERAMRPKIKIADAPLNDEAAQERQVAALMSAWNKASAEAREEFLARIDTPVMDRSAA